MNRKQILPYILISPGILILLSLVLLPILLTFSYSLYYFKLTNIDAKHFVYLGNYLSVLNNKEFYNAFINTFIIILIIIILGLIGSFYVAFLLKRESKLSNLLTGIAIIPWALPPIVNGLLWRFVFYPEIGIINKLIYFFNISSEPLNWLTSRYGTLFIIGVIISWRVVPFSAILLLTNMKAIPITLYEASAIDGANSFDRFKHITLPYLLPTIGIIICNFMLSGIGVFDEIISLVGNRTINETLTIYNYNETFSYFNIGYGSAVTYIIMILSGILGYIYIKILKQGVKNATF